MRKRYKLFSSIICLLLCVGMVAFGVYAAKTNLVKLNSTVSFTPTRAKLKIFGGIYNYNGYADNNSLDGSDKVYYATNKNKDALIKCTENGDVATFETWNYDQITFKDYTETNGKTHPDDIVFYIQITNYVERNVSYSIDLTAVPDNLSVECGYYITENSNITSANAKQNGWWDIESATTAWPTFATSTNKPTATSITRNDSKFMLGSDVTTSLSTIMFEIRLNVEDPDQDIVTSGANAKNFNFKINMI